MTSNLPPDWTAAAAEPREHYTACRTNCPCVEAVAAITIETQTWQDTPTGEIETRYLVKRDDEVYHAWYRLENAEKHAEQLRFDACMDHLDHTCNCEELAYSIGGIDTYGIWS